MIYTVVKYVVNRHMSIDLWKKKRKVNRYNVQFVSCLSAKKHANALFTSQTLTKPYNFKPYPN